MCPSVFRPLVVLALVLAAPAALAQPASVDGSNVQFVEFGGDSGERLGYFAQSVDGTWREVPSGDGGRFTFNEEGRDEWSVYLHDPSRDVRLQLDLYLRQVFYAEGSGPLTPLYRIYDVSDEPIPGSSPDSPSSDWTVLLPTAQQQALRDYLEVGRGFTVPGPERSPLTEGYDEGIISPFYLTGDFNGDGRTDFAVALVGPVQGGAEHPTLRVVIHNGAPGGHYRVAYEGDTWIDSRNFYMGADIERVYFGAAETDGTTILEPDGDGYIEVYPEDAP